MTNFQCACGCGEIIPDNPSRKYYPAKFRPGHNMRAIRVPHRRYVPNQNEIPSGKCECGCGQPTEQSDRTFRKLRWFKGHPRPYISGHHARKNARGSRLRKLVLTETEAAYFAGILDGEGTFDLRGGRSVRLIIGNCNTDLMEWLIVIGGGVHMTKQFPNRQPHYRWQLNQRGDVLKLLMQVEPYMLIKRTKAQEAIQLIQSLPHN